MIVPRTFLILALPFSLAACGTPTPLIESAKLSTVQMHALESETDKYLEDANSATAVRLDLLRQERARVLGDEREVAQRRLIALANIKAFAALDEELRKLTADYAVRDASVAAALQSYEARLSPITKAIKVPKESFKQVDEALAQLGEQSSAAERAAFILAYVRAVAGKYEEARKAEDAKAGQAKTGGEEPGVAPNPSTPSE